MCVIASESLSYMIALFLFVRCSYVISACSHVIPVCSYVILRFEFSEDALTAMEELTNILPSNVNIKVRQLGQTHSKFSLYWRLGLLAAVN